MPRAVNTARQGLEATCSAQWTGGELQYHRNQHVADGSKTFLSEGHVCCTLVQMHSIQHFFSTTEQHNLLVESASREFWRTAQRARAPTRRETFNLAKVLDGGRVLRRDSGKKHDRRLPATNSMTITRDIERHGVLGMKCTC